MNVCEANNLSLFANFTLLNELCSLDYHINVGVIYNCEIPCFESNVKPLKNNHYEATAIIVACAYSKVSQKHSSQRQSKKIRMTAAALK